MEKLIKEKFNEPILQETMRRYGISPNHIRLLDGFESFIYEFERDNREYILRLGHSHRRSVSLIRGEVDWINYLAAGGAAVAKAIPSHNGELVEPVDDRHGGHFLATAFVKAKGNPPGAEVWNGALLEQYGRLIGRMHALSLDYEPADPAWKRPEWDDPQMLDVEGWLPTSERMAAEKFLAVKAHLEALPKRGAGVWSHPSGCPRQQFFCRRRG